MLLAQFQNLGQAIFNSGLVASHSGNMSVRMGEMLFITRRGCMLGSIGENDLLEIGLRQNSRTTPLASVELPVHRAIYNETPAKAVLHAQPPHAIALSMTEGLIVPSDMEGYHLLPQVSVLKLPPNVSAGERAKEVARALKENQIVVVQGHGTFAIGQLLEEACQFTATLEQSCRIICLLRALGVNTPYSQVVKNP